MNKAHADVSRRGFLKGLGVTAAGSLMIPTLLNKALFAQEFTMVSVYARLAGSDTPPILLNDFATSAWICLGDQVELFWVTTPDVSQVDLGEGLGVFAADQGGNENGLNWGSTMVEPLSHSSFQIFALDGDYVAGNAAHVRVFDRPQGEGPFFPIDDGVFEARRISSNSSRINEVDEWLAVLPSDQFSPRLGVVGIRPLEAALKPAPFPWRVLKTDEDGVEHRFSLSAVANYQNPFTPAGTDVTLPLAGTYSFETRGNVPERDIPFEVKVACV